MSRSKALFVHHSVGRYIITRGGLRQRLRDAASGRGVEIDLWDHDYNKFGLTDGAGNKLGRSFPVPGDNTDPDGLLELFRQANQGAPFADELDSFDLVLTKSCYPNNAIKSDADVARLQDLYGRLFDELAKRAGTQHVLLTSPPLTPWRTDRAQAARARTVASWLSNLATPNNVLVVDIFSALAEQGQHTDQGMLRRDYRPLLPIDSHPNANGCNAAAALVSDAVSNLVLGKK